MNEDRFPEAVEIILSPDYEGIESNDPNDPGKLTRYGISKRAYPHLDIANLSREQARGIYLVDYWLHCRCNEMPFMLGFPVFDAAVNCGVYRSATFLQAALNVVADGIIGPKTLAAIRKLDDAGREAVLIDMIALRCKHYALQDDIDDFYARGWFRRVLRTYRTALAARPIPAPASEQEA